MALSKFTKAKRESLKKWRKLLRDLPVMSREEVEVVTNLACAFCHAYRKPGCLPEEQRCRRCPAYLNPCLSGKWQSYRINLSEERYWRKPAREFCDWVISEVSKLKDPKKG